VWAGRVCPSWAGGKRPWHPPRRVSTFAVGRPRPAPPPTCPAWLAPTTGWVNLARAAGRVDEAEQLYRHSLQIRLELAGLEPTNTDYRLDLAVFYGRLGVLAGDRDDTVEAGGCSA
jgi:hypothetical protein